jgi:hypothetical protein
MATSNSNCRTCGKQLYRAAKSGLCGICIRHDPEAKQRRTEGYRRALEERPELKAAIIARVRALTQTREHAERSRRSMHERKLWVAGQAAQGAGSDARKRAGRGIHETRMAWCPRHLRKDYRHMVDVLRYPAAEARQIILDQHETELRRLRIRMGAEKPDLSLVYIAPKPKLPKNLDELMERVAGGFGLTVADLTGRSREAVVVRARTALIAILRERGNSFPTIGRLVGGRDHTTIVHLFRKFEASADEGLRSIIASYASAEAFAA